MEGQYSCPHSRLVAFIIRYPVQFHLKLLFWCRTLIWPPEQQLSPLEGLTLKGHELNDLVDTYPKDLRWCLIKGHGNIFFYPMLLNKQWRSSVSFRCDITYPFTVISWYWPLNQEHLLLIVWWFRFCEKSMYYLLYHVLSIIPAVAQITPIQFSPWSWSAPYMIINNYYKNQLDFNTPGHFQNHRHRNQILIS